MTNRELERLYEDHAGAIFALAMNVLRQEAEARDVLQEIFTKLARQPGILSGVRQERAFLLTMTHRRALDVHRRRTVRARQEDTYATEQSTLFTPSADPDTQAFRVALSEAMAALPEDQHLVVHLKLWEGWTFEAIADSLQVSVNTAASRYRYALDKLRVRLRPIYEVLRMRFLLCLSDGDTVILRID
jgi:RNA polymerase sigma-70 factor (ECF subfamily)